VIAHIWAIELEKIVGVKNGPGELLIIAAIVCNLRKYQTSGGLAVAMMW